MRSKIFFCNLLNLININCCVYFYLFIFAKGLLFSLFSTSVYIYIYTFMYVIFYLVYLSIFYIIFIFYFSFYIYIYIKIFYYTNFNILAVWHFKLFYFFLTVLNFLRKKNNFKKIVKPKNIFLKKYFFIYKVSISIYNIFIINIYKLIFKYYGYCINLYIFKFIFLDYNVFLLNIDYFFGNKKLLNFFNFNKHLILSVVVYVNFFFKKLNLKYNYNEQLYLYFFFVLTNFNFRFINNFNFSKLIFSKLYAVCFLILNFYNLYKNLLNFFFRNYYYILKSSLLILKNLKKNKSNVYFSKLNFLNSEKFLKYKKSFKFFFSSLFFDVKSLVLFLDSDYFLNFSLLGFKKKFSYSFFVQEIINLMINSSINFSKNIPYLSSFKILNKNVKDSLVYFDSSCFEISNISSFDDINYINTFFVEDFFFFFNSFFNEFYFFEMCFFDFEFFEFDFNFYELYDYYNIKNLNKFYKEFIFDFLDSDFLSEKEEDETYIFVDFYNDLFMTNLNFFSYDLFFFFDELTYNNYINNFVLVNLFDILYYLSYNKFNLTYYDSFSFFIKNEINSYIGNCIQMESLNLWDFYFDLLLENLFNVNLLKKNRYLSNKYLDLVNFDFFTFQVKFSRFDRFKKPKIVFTDFDELISYKYRYYQWSNDFNNVLGFLNFDKSDPAFFYATELEIFTGYQNLYYGFRDDKFFDVFFKNDLKGYSKVYDLDFYNYYLINDRLVYNYDQDVFSYIQFESLKFNSLNITLLNDRFFKYLDTNLLNSVKYDYIYSAQNYHVDFSELNFTQLPASLYTYDNPKMGFLLEDRFFFTHQADDYYTDFYFSLYESSDDFVYPFDYKALQIYNPLDYFSFLNINSSKNLEHFIYNLFFDYYFYSLKILLLNHILFYEYNIFVNVSCIFGPVKSFVFSKNKLKFFEKLYFIYNSWSTIFLNPESFQKNFFFF